MNPVAPQSPIISINSNNGNVKVSYKNPRNSRDTPMPDEKCAVLEWLSPLELRGRHQAIGIDRVTGVGDWLLDSKGFIQWHEGSDEVAKPVLFCYGDPGVGKTYLSSLVIDKLWNQGDVDNMAIAGVYCDFHAQNEQSATGLLGALLKQVVSALESVPDEVQRAFGSSKGIIGGRRLLLPDILGILVKSLLRLQQGFIFIDALDEFPAKHRPELWGSLQQIVQECPNIRLFLTGRLHIRDEVQKYFPEGAAMMPIKPTEHDIELYLRMRLNRDPELDAMDKKLEAGILRIIPERMSGIFLFVCLSMDIVLAEPTTNQRRQALDRISEGIGLNDAYNTTLDRIKQQSASKSRLGMEALMWISHSERPLKSEELCLALGVQLGAEDFNIDNVPSIRTILDCMLGLVTIDERASMVRLLHPTLQVYLRGHPTLFLTAHSMMAEICLTFLNYRSARELPPTGHTLLATKPFLEYAACYWGTHAIKGIHVAMEVTEPVKLLALRLLDGYESHVSAAILWRMKTRDWSYEVDVQEISGLHCIALWGITEIADAMLEMERWDVNGRDSRGETPLMWAVKYQNHTMVELFLGQEDIKPDLAIRDGRTVFSFAAELGNKSAVQLLMKRADIDPESPDNNNRTALSYAAEEGAQGVVKLLLEHEDVEPDEQDDDGRAPLSYAAEKGVQSVVELLLKSGNVAPDLSDNNRRTALSFAAAGGHEGVVKLLLEGEDVNPDSPDSNGRTPLSYAAEEGSLSVVELVLKRGDVNPDSLDKNSRTPLSYAAAGGSEDIVGLLLVHLGVKHDSSDSRGQTPLAFAARNGHEGAVKLLLDHADVNPNSLDRGGETPLLSAALKGHEGVVRLLLGRGGANPNVSDSDGRTLLSHAAQTGEGSIVKLLLERGDVDIDSSDNKGRTPLSYAVGSYWMLEGIVKLLLDRVGIPPGSSDNKDRTPLPIAAQKGEEDAVKLPLDFVDVDPYCSDNNDRTLRSYPASG